MRPIPCGTTWVPCHGVWPFPWPPPRSSVLGRVPVAALIRSPPGPDGGHPFGYAWGRPTGNARSACRSDATPLRSCGRRHWWSRPCGEGSSSVRWPAQGWAGLLSEPTACDSGPWCGRSWSGRRRQRTGRAVAPGAASPAASRCDGSPRWWPSQRRTWPWCGRSLPGEPRPRHPRRGSTGAARLPR